MKSIRYKKNKDRKKRKSRKQKGGDQCAGLNKDKQIGNTTWTTCVDANNKKNDLFFIVPKNVVIKSVETAQIPEFDVRFSATDVPQQRKIKIEDKYVACFVEIENQWYAVMRLFGKTINTEIFAFTETNKAFYKLTDGCIAFDKQTGVITFLPEKYQEIGENNFFSTSSVKTVNLMAGCFQHLTKENAAFAVLDRFRLEKVFGNSVKTETGFALFDFVFPF